MAKNKNYFKSKNILYDDDFSYIVTSIKVKGSTTQLIKHYIQKELNQDVKSTVLVDLRNIIRHIALPLKLDSLLPYHSSMQNYHSNTKPHLITRNSSRQTCSKLANKIKVFRIQIYISAVLKQVKHFSHKTLI